MCAKILGNQYVSFAHICLCCNLGEYKFKIQNYVKFNYYFQNEPPSGLNE